MQEFEGNVRVIIEASNKVMSENGNEALKQLVESLNNFTNIEELPEILKKLKKHDVTVEWYDVTPV